MPFPKSPPDPTESGALTLPRQLQRWLDINPVTKLTRVGSYIVLPAFAVSAGWEGFSDLVLALDFQAPNNFSLNTLLFGGNAQSGSPAAPTGNNNAIVVTVINGNGLEGVGGPEGTVTANPGTTYVDTTTDDLWYKRTGVGNTGWRQLT